MINNKRNINIWLFICSLLVFSIIIIGGYTRLTHSGLSIVEWKPISGIIPPLNELAWEKDFSQYKESPEYKKVNFGMTLSEFKKIFLIEYLHRVLGRVMGLTFLIPFLYLFLKKKLSKYDSLYYLAISFLIGSQGLIGWLMVKSGLIDQPNVSQYRLSTHLLMACIILILLTWKIIPGESRNSKYANISITLLLLQVVSGAFVAGLHAGLVYNTFPLMDGKILPNGLLSMNPWYKNFFENITMVQFTHRILGIINIINLLAYSFKILNLKKLKKIAICLASFVVIQFSLGILTLIFQVTLLLAMLHQTMAIILLITMVISLKDLRNKSE